VVVFSLTFLEKSIPAAYALEQTIQANHSVRFLHIINFDPSHEEPKQWWVECDDTGQVKNLRWYMPEWDAPEDGAKVGIWRQGIAKIWFKKKKSLLIYRGKRVADWMFSFVKNHDPRSSVESLQEKAEHGQVNIEIDQPSDKSKPVIVTATYLANSETPNRRQILFVDQATKLVTCIEFYKEENNQYSHQCTREYHDYNIPIDSKMFSIEDEVPDDVTVLDWVYQLIGIAQGEMTDEEAAIETVRQFFQALIDKDYQKAGLIFSGVSEEKAKKYFSKLNVTRIIAIGPAHPYPQCGEHSFEVYVEYEVTDSNGNKRIRKQLGPKARCGDDEMHPDRWVIHGGI